MRKGLQIPNLNSLIYDVAYNISHAASLDLPDRYREICNSELKMQRFIRSAGLEQKIEFLSHVGIKFFMFFANEDNIKIKGLKGILSSYKEGKPFLATKEMAEQSFYVISNKELIHLLSLMSQSAAISAYSESLIYNKSGYNPKRWKREYEYQIDGETESNKGYLRDTATYINEALKLSSLSSGFLGIPENDFRILLFLYKKPHIYISRKEIDDEFKAIIKSILITTSIKRLIEDNFILKSVVSEINEYTISGFGISIVEKFINKLSQKTIA